MSYIRNQIPENLKNLKTYFRNQTLKPSFRNKISEFVVEVWFGLAWLGLAWKALNPVPSVQ